MSPKALIMTPAVQWELTALVQCCIFAAQMGSITARMAGNEVDLEIGDADGCIKRTEGMSYYIWQYFTVSNSSDPQNSGAKIAVCKFCDNPLSGCWTAKGCLVQVGNGIELEAVGLLFEPYPGCGSLWCDLGFFLKRKNKSGNKSCC